MPAIVIFMLGAIALAFAPLGAAVLFVVIFVLQAAVKRGAGAVARMAGRQLWRLKWLLLASFALMAFAAPGAPLAAGLPDFLPSREGLLLAAEQLARVALVILLFAAQPGLLSTEQRVAALYRLLALFGAGGERAALRIALSLRELETARREDHWAALREDAAATPGPERWVIDLPKLNAGDRWLMIGAVLAFLLCAGAAFWRH